MNKSLILIFCTTVFLSACSSNDKRKNNEINLSQSVEDASGSASQDQEKVTDLPLKPNTVLLTGDPNYRLVTVYKEKISKDGKYSYVDGNYYHHSSSDYSYDTENASYDMGNAWHTHYLPGLEAVYGYNMYNIAHYDITQRKKKYLFDHPVLVNTLYYPSYQQDTLLGKPVKRDYYLVSVYNEDTNKDSIINVKDLRRLYHFDLEASKMSLLIPLNYSVFKSEYDPQNDAMYIFAKLDQNSNGLIDRQEPTHIFLLNLRSPVMGEKLF